VYGVVVAGMAFIIAGGGHGWTSALISSVGLVLLPALGVAWTRSHRPTVLGVLAAAVTADIALGAATAREGFEYVERVFASFPVFVLGWLLLWLGWQGVVIVGLLRGTFASRPNI
jgi:hypothetical protein